MGTDFITCFITRILIRCYCVWSSIKIAQERDLFSFPMTPFLPGSVTSDGNENCHCNVIPNPAEFRPAHDLHWSRGPNSARARFALIARAEFGPVVISRVNPQWSKPSVYNRRSYPTQAWRHVSMVASVSGGSCWLLLCGGGWSFIASPTSWGHLRLRKSTQVCTNGSWNQSNVHIPL